MTGNGTETYLQKSREITSYELIFWVVLSHLEPQGSALCWQNQDQAFYFTLSLTVSDFAMI